MKLPRKIISGGQTGVDQGALDFALARGMPCGGWCPPGRQCETGRIPDRYPLREVEGDDYNERTRRNILEAGATLVITHQGLMEEGTRLTIEWTEASGRPCFRMDLEDLNEPDTGQVSDALDWLVSVEPEVLNVAGNRESTAPGIRRMTVRILEELIGKR